MYTVVELKLNTNVDLKIKDTRSPIFSSVVFGNPAESASRFLSLNIPGDSAWASDVHILQYVVGEKIQLKRSLLGMKILQGSPDHTGRVKRNKVNVQEILKNRKDFSASRRNMFYQNNLCQEVVLHGDAPVGVTIAGGHLSQAEIYQNLWAEGTRNLYYTRAGHTEQRALTRRTAEQEAIWMEELAHAMQAMEATSRYRGRGPSGPTRRYDYLGGDFDGDSFITAPRGTFDLTNVLATPQEPEPRFAPSPIGELQPMPLREAAAAVSELVEGTRGRPRTSNGPRPRNQRW